MTQIKKKNAKYVKRKMEPRARETMAAWEKIEGESLKHRCSLQIRMFNSWMFWDCLKNSVDLIYGGI